MKVRSCSKRLLAAFNGSAPVPPKRRAYRSLVPALWLLAWSAAAWLRADDWPQWLGPERDAVWREQGILERFPPGGPKVRWRAKIGSGYAGPAVAQGRVYVLDRQLAPGNQKPSDPFARGQIPGSERILCLAETDGRLLWQQEYDSAYTASYPAGPRATPLVSGGKVYTLGTEGHLLCCDAVQGTVLWRRDLRKDYGVPTPMWGFAGHPLLDGPRLYCLVGGQGTAAVALDKDTGRELWRALTVQDPGYSPPTLISVHGKTQLIIWHSESVNALEPPTGRLLWSVPFKVRSGLSIATPRQAGDRLFLSAFYDGSLMLRLEDAKAEPVWRSSKSSERDTDCLHSLMCTPFIEDGHIYGICSYGQLRCLRAATGERLWESLAVATDGKETRWGNAFLVKHGPRFFLFNEKGDLIIARLSPKGYDEIDRARLLEPTNTDPGRPVVWSHPAFANRSIYARNDRELVCASLAAE